MDSELDQILDDTFLADLSNWDLDRLRSSRERCQRLETSLSYLRRLAQGRIDIVATEITRRAEGGDPTELEQLVGQLPEVLSERTHAPGAGHLPRFLAPGELHGALVEELAGMEVEAHLSELPHVTDEWLTNTREHLISFEAQVSAMRRGLFERIDAIQDEMTRRYRVGEANIDTVIAQS